MPLSRTIDPRDRFLRTTLTPPLSLRDVESHLNVVFSVGVEACPELIDARQVDPGHVSVREVMVTLRHFGLGREEFAPRALVVSSETMFAVARTVSVLVSGWVRVGVFYEADIARDWLMSRVSPLAMDAWRAALSRSDVFELSETA
jgi:hypothetical protein